MVAGPSGKTHPRRDGETDGWKVTGAVEREGRALRATHTMSFGDPLTGRRSRSERGNEGSNPSPRSMWPGRRVAHPAACNAADAGSTPALASKFD